MKKIKLLALILFITTFISCDKDNGVSVKKQEALALNRDTGYPEGQTEKEVIQLNRECLAKALSIVLKDHVLRNDIIELHKTIPKGYDGFFLNEVKDQRILINNTKTLAEILTPYLICTSTPDVLNFLCEKDPLLIIMIFNPLKNYTFTSSDIKVFIPQDRIEELPSQGFSMPYFLEGIKNTWAVKVEPTYNVFVIKKSERARVGLVTDRQVKRSFEKCGKIITVLEYINPDLDSRGGPTGGGDECQRDSILKKEFFEEFYSEDDSEGCCFKTDADFVMHHIWGVVNSGANASWLITTKPTTFGWDEDIFINKWTVLHSEIINWNPNTPVNDYDRMKYFLIEDDAGEAIKVEVGFDILGVEFKTSINATDDDDIIGGGVVDFCDPLLAEYKIRLNWDCKFKPTMKKF